MQRSKRTFKSTPSSADSASRLATHRSISFPLYRACCLVMASTMGPLSPSTSPRLPSPPPFPEVQIGLRSPRMNAASSVTSPRLPNLRASSPELPDTPKLDDGPTRRIRPGTKAADMASGPPLVPLAELQEHLKALYHYHTKSDQTNTTMALSRETAQIIATPPEGIDKSLWLYELCRLLVLKANSLIVAFFDERPPCSSGTCPEMRASEWQYLCAVHDPPKSCCAIDYCCHTLDWAANVLTSQKNFPSRLTLGSDTTGGSQQGIRQLTNIFRRVYRIFAHAWFQHRQSFWEVEGKEGIYILFKIVCDTYNLIPEENYTISPEAEGILAAPEEEREKEKEKENKSILRKKDGEDSKLEESNATGTNAAGTNHLAATTKRHRHTLSTGFTTIAEGGEEEKLKSGSDLDTSSTTSKSTPSAGKRLHKHTQSVIPAVPTIAESDEEEIKMKSLLLSQQLEQESDGTPSTPAKTAQPIDIFEPPKVSEKAETTSPHQPVEEKNEETTHLTGHAEAPQEGEEGAPPVPPKLEGLEQEQEKLEEPPSKGPEAGETNPA